MKGLTHLVMLSGRWLTRHWTVAPCGIVIFLSMTVLAQVPEVSPQVMERRTEVPAALPFLEKGESRLDLASLQKAEELLVQDCQGGSERPAQCEYQLARVYLALFTYWSSQTGPEAAAKTSQYLAMAEAAARAAAARSPDDPAPHVLLGRIAQIGLTRNYITGLTTAALSESPVVSHYNRALELDPNNGEAELGLGIYYMSIPQFLGGDLQRARRHFQRAIKLRPQDPEPLVWMSRSYRVEGRLHESRRYMERAKTLAPSNYSVQVEEARLREAESPRYSPLP
jgi:tetratricopeptide (TPR) repeat protein